MTYNREQHALVAVLAKAAMARSGEAHRRASNATFALIVPVMLHQLDAMPAWVVWASAAAWLYFALNACVLMVEAHRLVTKLDRLNRDAL